MLPRVKYLETAGVYGFVVVESLSMLELMFVVSAARRTARHCLQFGETPSSSPRSDTFDGRRATRRLLASPITVSQLPLSVSNPQSRCQTGYESSQIRLRLRTRRRNLPLLVVAYGRPQRPQ